MLFSRVASFFAFFFTLGALALAGPAAKRQTDITSILSELQSSTSTILPELRELHCARCFGENIDIC